MTKSYLGVAVALLATVCLPVSAARAAMITETYDFTASGLSPGGGPVDPWMGSFTINYDPTNPGALGPSSLLAFSSNLNTLGYPDNTFMYSQSSTQIFIGDNCHSGSCDVNPGNNQAFFSFFVDAAGNPTSAGNATSGGFATITTVSNTSGDFTTFGRPANLSVTLTPLPTALPLFAGGLGALGLLGWRRKRKAAAAA
jgi:hypothetical protein